MLKKRPGKHCFKQSYIKVCSVTDLNCKCVPLCKEKWPWLRFTQRCQYLQFSHNVWSSGVATPPHLWGIYYASDEIFYKRMTRSVFLCTVTFNVMECVRNKLLPVLTCYSSFKLLLLHQPFSFLSLEMIKTTASITKKLQS